MQDNNDFIEIKIDFERGQGDPTRIFRAMAGLIESTQMLDDHLSATISTKVHTSLVLQDVEASSLKSKLKTIIEQIPDEPLKEGDVNAIIGSFLHNAKHKVLDWCSDRKEIKDRDEIKKLEKDIHSLAEESALKTIPAYEPIETASLLSDINSIKTALEVLNEKDTATFETAKGLSTYNRDLDIAQEVVRELITRETIISEADRIIKIKKPDYLGVSKWGFKYAGRLIDAKILDERWLNEFQGRKRSIHPGDSLRVLLKEEIYYGYNNEVVHTHYEVIKVHEIIPAQMMNQGQEGFWEKSD